MPDDRPTQPPGWITMVRSTGDLAADLATARAQLVAVRLAQALAQRLDAVVPRPISVAAQQDWVVVRWPHRGGAAWDRAGRGAAGERWAHLGVAVWSVLNGVQAFVVQDRQQSWPAPAVDQPAGAVPVAGVAVEADRIRLWYGEAAHPALGLPPIPRQELLG
jgi:hypothetical protein